MASLQAGRAGLSLIVQAFKAGCTREIRKSIDPTFTWQARYHDHIIRDNDDLEHICYYIRNNPENWEEDEIYVSPPNP